MTGTTLRELARAYAKGELGRDEYRRSRADLVASILSGEVVVKNIDFPPPVKPPSGDGQDATEPRPRRRRPDATLPDGVTVPETSAAPLPMPAATKAPPASTKWLIIGILTLGIIAIGGYLIASKETRPAAPAASSAGTPVAPAPSVPADDPLAEAGKTLIGQFLQDRNWSAPRLAAFLSDWSALDVQQQAAALKSADAGRLASAIYQRLLEERALSGLGDAGASLAKQRELVDFAGAVGIRDPRLSVPEPAATSETATTPGDAGAAE